MKRDSGRGPRGIAALDGRPERIILTAMARRTAGDMQRGSRADPEICARCADVGRCCCVLAPGQEELCFPVSEMERQRIVESGPGRAGLSAAPNSEAFLGLMSRMFPRDRTWLAQMFPAGGGHLRLATPGRRSLRLPGRGGVPPAPGGQTLLLPFVPVLDIGRGRRRLRGQGVPGPQAGPHSLGDVGGPGREPGRRAGAARQDASGLGTDPRRRSGCGRAQPAMTGIPCVNFC